MYIVPFCSQSVLCPQLLRGLRGTSFELREEYGRCLGELGAVDPGKYVLTFHTMCVFCAYWVAVCASSVS